MKMICKRLSLLSSALLVMGLLYFTVGVTQAQALAIKWDGGGGDNNWSTCANWDNSNTCPTSGDTVTFDATSTKASTIDASFTGTISSLTIASGYTNTITMSRSLTTSGFTMGTGTTGTFTMGSQTMTDSGVFLIQAGTFNANTGTIDFSGTTASIDCNSASFTTAHINFTGQTGVKTIGATSACSFPLGSAPTVPNGLTLTNATLSGSGTLTATTGTLTFNNAAATLSGFSGLNVFAFTVSGATLNLSSYTSFLANGTVFISNGTLSLPTGATIYGNFAQTGGTFNAPALLNVIATNLTAGTFNNNNGTVNFIAPNPIVQGTGIISNCHNNNVFHLVTINDDPNGQTWMIFRNCTLPLGNNPTVAGELLLNLNSVAIGTGILTTDYLELDDAASSISGFSGLKVNQWADITNDAVTLNLSAYNPVEIGYLYVDNGTFIAPPGTLTLDTGIDASYATGGPGTPGIGVFNANGGTVVIKSGVDHTIRGNITFNNLTVNTSASDILTFKTGFTTTVAGALNLNGDNGHSLTLKSFIHGTQWAINPQGPRSISYVNVSDSNNINSTPISVGAESINSGNNTNWLFDQAPNAPTNLGPNNLINGTFSGSSQPAFTFNLSDPDASNTVAYEIQVDDTSDFSSPVIDFTSGLTTQGNQTFTVGQGAGSGTYGTGAANQSLADASYYWRVKAFDASGGSSAYTTANSGNVAFKIDTSGQNPDGPQAFDLYSPSDLGYINTDRPTFSWQAVSDPSHTLAGYTLQIDNGDSGSFAVTNIPVSGTNDIVTPKYVIHFSNFDDSYSTNDTISVYTKSSGDWQPSENDGKLKEGQHSWKVIAIGNSGLSRSKTATAFVDFSAPVITSVQTDNQSNLQPTISGKISDPLVGDSTNDVVASGPASAQITIEQKNLLGLYSLVTRSGLTIKSSAWQVSNPQLSGNLTNKSYIFANFSFTSPVALAPGSYRAIITGKDAVGNLSRKQLITFDIQTSDSVSPPASAQIPQLATNSGNTGSIKDLVASQAAQLAQLKHATQANAPHFADFFLNLFNQLVPHSISISHIVIDQVTPTSAKISWQTEWPASASLTYQSADNQALEIQEPSQTRSHTFTLNNLQPATNYSYMVTSQSQGHYAVQTGQTFSTTAR